MTSNKYLILYNLRSAYNVGAIFRTADAVGISHIFLVGTTPRPIDEYKRPNNRIQKSALGAEKSVSWSYCKTLGPLFKKIKNDKIEIIALEQNLKSVDYRRVKLPQRWALIVGEETKGLSKIILDKTDLIIEIPMKGVKESLNVSVACGVALFKLIEKENQF